MGLALRHLLGWLLRPILFLLRPIFWVLRPIWRFWGRLGLAIRHLLVWFVWEPFLFITTPLRWFFRRLIYPILIRPIIWLLYKVATILYRYLLAPIGRWLASFVRARWQAGQPGRIRWRRRWHSRRMLYAARLRFFFRRPTPPAQGVFVPDANTGLSYQITIAQQKRRVRWRLFRFAATLIALNIILVGLGSIIPKETTSSSANVLPTATFLPPTPTPTSSPTETPTPTLTPIPVPTMAPPPPTPNLLDSGGSVLFALWENGNSDIYGLTLGQTKPVRLTRHPAEDRDPAWSPDGTQIAFASRRDGNWDLYVMDLRIAEIRRVTTDMGFDAGPNWSPDGQWLVYESYLNNNLDIFITKADGSTAPIRLTQHIAPDFAPVWSPGGRHIAFTSWRTGNKDVFIMPLDAAQDSLAMNVTGSPDRHEDNPVFNPAGDFLAFDDDSSGFDIVYGVALEEYEVKGEVVTLGQGKNPTWSPTGEALIYVHQLAEQSFLLAGSFGAWSIAPQAYGSAGTLDDPYWSAYYLPPGLASRLPDPLINEPLFTELLSPPQTFGAPYLVQELAVRAPSPYLSDRVNDSFLALRDRVWAETSQDYLGQLDNLFESLTTLPLPGQYLHSWNKAGRAFDLNYRPVLSFEPPIEVVRQDRGYEVYWTLFFRAGYQDGSQGEPLRELPWDFRARYGQDPRYYDEGGKWKEQIPNGYYLNFTQLAQDYGWQRVPADDAWRTYFPSIRFWHFENHQQLSWEEAMLELYSPTELVELLDNLSP